MPHLEGRAKALAVLIPMVGRTDLRLHRHLRSARRTTEQQPLVGGCSGCPCGGATAGWHILSSFVSTRHKGVAMVPTRNRLKSNDAKNLIIVVVIEGKMIWMVGLGWEDEEGLYSSTWIHVKNWPWFGSSRVGVGPMPMHILNLSTF